MAADKHNEERRELTGKLERTAADLAKRERQITTLENQREALTS